MRLTKLYKRNHPTSIRLCLTRRSDLTADRIYGATRHGCSRAAKPEPLEEISIPEERARHWRVGEEFVEAIRTG